MGQQDTPDATLGTEEKVDANPSQGSNSKQTEEKEAAENQEGQGKEIDAMGEQAENTVYEAPRDADVDETKAASDEVNEPISTTVEVPKVVDRSESEPELGSEETPEAVEGPDSGQQTKVEQTQHISLRDEESKLIGAEIVFERKPKPDYNGWDNLRWMAYSGTRKVRYCELVSRFVAGRRSLFWSGDQYLTRKLAIYDEPNLILILRAPESLAELREIMDLPVGATIEDQDTAFKSYLVVESVIDPKTCKLRLSPLTTATSILPGVDDLRRRSCLELINPVESAILSAVKLRKGAERALTSFTDSGAFLETSSAEHVLQKFICDANQPIHYVGSPSDLSWKHQIILGTLHSFVVLGNHSFLDMAIAAALNNSKGGEQTDSNYLEPRIVDAVDSSGRTPLHYACSSRFSSAVVSLVKAGANVDFKTGPYKMTSCHVCALNLDDKSLAAILAVNRRPNVVDTWGRTPMYLAISEGSTVGGQRNPEALDRCLTLLGSYGGQIEGSLGFRHPVSYLASIWCHEELSVVLKHVNFRYPLILPYAEDKKRVGISVSALYQYPVHSCLVSLRKKIKTACEGVNVQQLWSDCAEADSTLIITLEELFNCGFEPNERLEGVLESFDGFDELGIHVGFAPIQIVAAAALDASSHKDLLGETLFMSIMGLIANVYELLVKYGARISLDQPPAMRSAQRSCSSIADSSTGSEEGNEDVKPVDRSHLKIQSNKQIADLLGVLRLDSAEMVWNSVKSVQSAGTFIFHSDKLAIEDSEAPGGSDEKSCAICWKTFGKLINRKHRCRVTRRHVCDQCSSKRVVENDEEHRVSDGQFLLAKADETRSESKRLEAAKELERRVQQHPSASSAAVRLDRLEAEDRDNRDSLFGSVMGSVAKAVFGDEAEETAESRGDTVQGLSDQLNQTRDALNQRGEKLNTLAEKSDKLVNASQDFASMAKELNRKSQGGLFW
jgi:hypothetical protein